MTPVQLLANFCKKHLLWVLATVLLGLLEAVCNSVGIALIMPAAFGFLGLVNPNQILSGMIFSELMPPAVVNILPAFVIGLLLLKIVIASGANAVKADLIRQMELELRMAMLDKFLKVDLSFVRTMPPGDVLHRIGYSVTVSVASFGFLLECIRLTLGASILFLILLYCSWQLTLLAGLLFLLLILALQLTSKRSRELGKHKTEVARTLVVFVKDLVDGIRTVKERGSESFELRRLARLFRISKRVNFLSQTHILITDSVCEFVALTILLSALLALRWTVLLIYLPVMLRLLTILNRLGNAYTSLINSYPEFSSIADFFNQTEKKQLTGGMQRLETLKNGIELENIRFAHGQLKSPLFDGLSLRIEKGTTFAIVGVSGVGKTTLCDLLLRFYDPDGGRILLDGIDLKEFDLDSLRKKIAIINQDNYLFARSVKSNIMLGVHGVSSERFNEAISTAGLNDVVQRLPHDVNSLLGARGSFLSLGERQRIAIARAIVIQPEILILDEATGAIDPLLDRQIHSALKQMGPDCTRIIISHRPSTIRQAQVIALISKGRVTEVGSHDELMRMQGEYAQLYGDE